MSEFNRQINTLHMSFCTSHGVRLKRLANQAKQVQYNKTIMLNPESELGGN